MSVIDVRVDLRPIAPARIERALRRPTAGAIVLFLGRVRPDPSGRGRVAALLYEAHREMAIARLTELAERALRRYGLLAVIVQHRTGRVPVGTASVAIGVASAHRAPAFAAARALMESVKHEVPIWKTELRRPAAAGRRGRARRSSLRSPK